MHPARRGGNKGEHERHEYTSDVIHRATALFGGAPRKAAFIKAPRDHVIHVPPACVCDAVAPFFPLSLSFGEFEI